jgi:hypothetical protein
VRITFTCRSGLQAERLGEKTGSAVKALEALLEVLYKAGGASLPADSIACGDEHGSHTGLCKELRAIAIFAPSVTGSHP